MSFDPNQERPAATNVSLQWKDPPLAVADIVCNSIPKAGERLRFVGIGTDGTLVTLAGTVIQVIHQMDDSTPIKVIVD